MSPSLDERAAGGAAPGHVAPSNPKLQALRLLAPHVWRWRWRLLGVLVCLVAAKVANVGVPWVLKHVVDALQLTPGDRAAVLVVPVAWLVAYGVLRLSVTLFTEAREWFFYPTVARISREVTLQAFGHLLAMSMRFHLTRASGGVSRDMERGTRAIQQLLNYSITTTLPTLVEVGLVMAVLGTQLEGSFLLITLGALVLYIGFTVLVTEWRTRFRRRMNEQDSLANSRAVDALINVEVVKTFAGEAFERQRYDDNLRQLEAAALRSQSSLSLLNLGQSLIIALAVSLLVWRATVGVVEGRMSLGDLVLVNALMIQLTIPLNFLGVIYRELKQAMIDLEKLFQLLAQAPEVQDAAQAQAFEPQRAQPPGLVFRDLHFSYEPGREVLRGLSFEVPPGRTVAVVGPSGSGKSTLARLLFRFHDVQAGTIELGGVDIRQLTQTSLRQHLGLVPQDTVLFNDTLAYNIAYGRPSASRDEIEAAARAAQLMPFVQSTPKGLDTLVGERGLKLSGGEKQRVALARAFLKNPPVLVFDEATSALDSANERAIQAELKQLAAHKTTLVIAHRLSTIQDAHEIIVLDAGRIVERGRHHELLALGGHYARAWELQQAKDEGKGYAEA